MLGIPSEPTSSRTKSTERPSFHYARSYLRWLLWAAVFGIGVALGEVYPTATRGELTQGAKVFVDHLGYVIIAPLLALPLALLGLFRQTPIRLAVGFWIVLVLGVGLGIRAAESSSSLRPPLSPATQSSPTPVPDDRVSTVQNRCAEALKHASFPQSEIYCSSLFDYELRDTDIVLGDTSLISRDGQQQVAIAYDIIGASETLLLMARLERASGQHEKAMADTYYARDLLNRAEAAGGGDPKVAKRLSELRQLVRGNLAEVPDSRQAMDDVARCGAALKETDYTSTIRWCTTDVTNHVASDDQLEALEAAHGATSESKNYVAQGYYLAARTLVSLSRSEEQAQHRERSIIDMYFARDLLGHVKDDDLLDAADRNTEREMQHSITVFLEEGLPF